MSPSTASAVCTPTMKWQPIDGYCESAMTVQTPSHALGFPRAEVGPHAVTAQPPLALSPTDAASVQDAGGFAELPVVLVAQIVVAYLGILGWAEIRNLAQQYPGFREAIGAAVDADPMFQPLGKLVAPMRTIALRDLLDTLAEDFHTASRRQFASGLSDNEREDLDRLVDRGNLYGPRRASQTRLAEKNLRSRVWLPLVEQLVQHRVNGVRPEHSDLLTLCDRMLAGQLPNDMCEMDKSVASAKAIGLKEKQWRESVDIAYCHPPGRDRTRLYLGIAHDRNDVLSNAFARITSAFAAKAGWTFDELMAESQNHPLTRRDIWEGDSISTSTVARPGRQFAD